MTIRPALPTEIPALVAMGTRFLHASPYKDVLTENPAQMATLCEQLLAHGGTILVLVDSETLVGMIGLHCAPHFLSGDLSVGEVFWWVEPDYRGQGGVRLLRAAERWAREQGATTMQMVAPDERVGMLYARLGYRAMERSFVKAMA